MASPILIVEDDPFHLKFIEDQFSDDAFAEYRLECFESGDLAHDWLRQNKPNRAMIDLNLPGKNGVEVATRVWQKDPSASVVFWSNFSDPAYVRAIAKIVPEHGNFGYILKTMAAEKLQRSLKGVLFDGLRIIDSEVQGFINRRNARRAQLNPVEIEVLNLIALGITDRAISAIIGTSQRTIQATATSIFDKLGGDEEMTDTLNKRSRLVALALMEGEINRDTLLEHETRRSVFAKSGK